MVVKEEKFLIVKKPDFTSMFDGQITEYKYSKESLKLMDGMVRSMMSKMNLIKENVWNQPFNSNTDQNG